MLSYLQSWIAPEEKSDAYISEIWVHPIKSVGGVKLDESEIDEHGFKYDRMYMVCQQDKKSDDPNALRFVTLREVPQLSVIDTTIDEPNNQLVLVYKPTGAKLVLPLQLPDSVKDNAPKVNAWIWGDTPQSLDLGLEYPEIIDFFNQVLGSDEIRTTLVASDARRLVTKGVKAGDVRGREDQPTSSFQDHFPGNLITEKSLADLQGRVSEKQPDIKLSARNFRPNIVIADTNKAWDEDEWKRVRIGESSTWFIPCRDTRCRVTTVNNDTGEFHKSNEPLKTLQSFRRVDPGAKHKSCFGMHMVNEQIGFKVKVGDNVTVLKRGEHIYPLPSGD